MKATIFILNHVNYTKSDYNYLSAKGYSNKEIKSIWDNDLSNHGVKNSISKIQLF